MMHLLALATALAQSTPVVVDAPDSFVGTHAGTISTHYGIALPQSDWQDSAWVAQGEGRWALQKDNDRFFSAPSCSGRPSEGSIDTPYGRFLEGPWDVEGAVAGMPPGTAISLPTVGKLHSLELHHAGGRCNESEYSVTFSVRDDNNVVSRHVRSFPVRWDCASGPFELDGEFVDQHQLDDVGGGSCCGGNYITRVVAPYANDDRYTVLAARLDYTVPCAESRRGQVWAVSAQLRDETVSGTFTAEPLDGGEDTIWTALEVVADDTAHVQLAVGDGPDALGAWVEVDALPLVGRYLAYRVQFEAHPGELAGLERLVFYRTSPVDPETLDSDGDGTPDDADCAPHDATIAPGLPERCNGIDDNCDGGVDLDAIDRTTFFRDLDGDGFGFMSAAYCEPPVGFSVLGGDCDDADPSVHPDATEQCNGVDDNCDGVLLADEDAAGWLDADGDGVGNSALPAQPMCVAHTVSVGGDCDDADPARAPGLSEQCDGVDNDCDGVVPSEESLAPADADGDGFGDPSRLVRACELATAADTSDCADNDASVSPAATEVCDDGLDNDCNGRVDAVDPACSTASASGCSTVGGSPWLGLLALPLVWVRRRRAALAAVALAACGGESAEECGNGIDDDGNGLIDCFDAACYGAACVEDCSSPFDEDGDGLVGCDDEDCTCQTNAVPVEQCGSGVDEDGDGLVDCADADCWGAGCSEQCGSGQDEDADGLVDCADDDCIGVEGCAAECGSDDDCGDPACWGPDCTEVCDAPGDEDGDGLSECADPDCHGSGLCREVCGSGLDEDGDGVIDCADPDCFGRCPEACDLPGDEDDDGLADCADPDCFGPDCTELCTVPGDEDGDGLAECEDPDCSLEVDCLEQACDDEQDNDGDGLVDCDDADCWGLGCAGFELSLTHVGAGVRSVAFTRTERVCLDGTSVDTSLDLSVRDVTVEGVLDITSEEGATSACDVVVYDVSWAYGERGVQRGSIELESGCELPLQASFFFPDDLVPTADGGVQTAHGATWYGAAVAPSLVESAYGETSSGSCTEYTTQSSELERNVGHEAGGVTHRAGYDPSSLSSCKDALEKGFTESGTYTITPRPGVGFDVYCDQETAGGGWTLVGTVSAVPGDDGGALGGDDERWLSGEPLGDTSTLAAGNALGPAYNSVSFTDFLLRAVDTPSEHLAWRHDTELGSMGDVVRAGQTVLASEVLSGSQADLAYREGCVANAPADRYGFNIPAESNWPFDEVSLVNGAIGGTCVAVAGWGVPIGGVRDYSGGGVGAVCWEARLGTRGQSMWRYSSTALSACTYEEYRQDPRNRHIFDAHAFFVR